MNDLISNFNTVGYIMPNIGNHFFTNIAQNIEKFLLKRNYNLIISNTHNNREIELEKIKQLSTIADGLIITSLVSDYSDILSVLPDNYPHIFLYLCPENSTTINITVNNYIAVYRAVLSMISSGEEKIGCIYTDYMPSIHKNRTKGYKDAMNTTKEGFNPDLLICTSHDGKPVITCSEAIEQLLNKECTAILTCNQSNTIEAYNYLTSQLCKKQFRISGFFHQSTLSSITRFINIISEPSAELGQFAAQQILYKITHPDTDTKNYMFKSNYISSQISE